MHSLPAQTYGCLLGLFATTRGQRSRPMPIQSANGVIFILTMTNNVDQTHKVRLACFFQGHNPSPLRTIRLSAARQARMREQSRKSNSGE